MALIHTDSLAATLDAVNDALFWDRKLTKEGRKGVARWIASRQGLPGAYAGMFAPPEEYRTQRLRLFTGEARASRAGAALVLGNEACRALALVDVRVAFVQEALVRAREGMLARLGPLASGSGTYCCTSCTPAVWRNLAVWDADGAEAFLAAGVRALRERRLGDGKWRRYPFWYTLLVLSEMSVPGAIAEMRHAAPVCERTLGRAVREGLHEQRRQEVCRRVLASC